MFTSDLQHIAQRLGWPLKSSNPALKICLVYCGVLCRVCICIGFLSFLIYSHAVFILAWKIRIITPLDFYGMPYAVFAYNNPLRFNICLLLFLFSLFCNMVIKTCILKCCLFRCTSKQEKRIKLPDRNF